MKKVWIYLEHGLFLEGRSFGAEGTKTGEIVFNTSMTGYQEIVSDPSYAGQFITFTMPEIGNVGVNEEDMESKRAWAKGIIVRQYQPRYSNFRAQRALEELLKEFGVMGICDIDTRLLTKTVRDKGACMMIASTEVSDEATLKELLEAAPRIEEIDYIKEVSTKGPYKHTHATYDARAFCYKDAPKAEAKIYVLDFGVKRNILNNLVEAGLEVEVLPHTFDPQKIIEDFQAKRVDGVFLSNGPGDPLILKEVHQKIQKLLEAKIPMFGICLGHQLLSIAHGYDTFKLKFGHHGGNHPVRNEATGRVEITAQNHNYNVPEAIEKIAEITHKNLFDGTIEGIKYKDEPVFSVQHHPEASPGPHESAYIFKEFTRLIKEHRC